jgi:diadenosine tetraphosphate (Ap4A) HIT family hydrolase
MPKRKPFDVDGYIQQIQTAPCFLCRIIAAPRSDDYVIYRDDVFVALLDKYPALYGHTLVAPIRHREQVTGDLSLEEYLALQRGVYCVAEAVRRTVDPERVYILSLGSQQGNRHVHWHIAPLPRGVPFREQQLRALSVETGTVDVPPNEMAGLATCIRQNMDDRLLSSQAAP